MSECHRELKEKGHGSKKTKEKNRYSLLSLLCLSPLMICQKQQSFFVSLYMCDSIIVVWRRSHRFWRLWKNLKRGRRSVVRHTNWCALSFNQEHHQLSPENSNLNQRRLTDAPLLRTIIHWFPLETI